MEHLQDLVARFPALRGCEGSIRQLYERLAQSFAAGGRLYLCGNGGSAADALHITGELVKSFRLRRPVDTAFAARARAGLAEHLQGALPVFALVENTALATAFANDADPEYVFAQQVYAYAREGDCVLGISTSGNSRDVLYALEAARGRGAAPLGLTGRDGGAMKGLCDVCVVVPEMETDRIQELHLPVYHTLCAMLEEHFWGGV